MVVANPNVDSWTSAEVCRWLQDLGQAYTMYAVMFQFLGICGRKLLNMKAPNDFDMVMVDLHRKKMHNGVIELRRHMKAYRARQTKKLLVVAASKQKTHPTQNDIIDGLLSHYSGNELDGIVVNVIANSLPRLTTETKLKILNLLQKKISDRS